MIFDCRAVTAPPTLPAHVITADYDGTHFPFREVPIPPARSHNARVPQPWSRVLHEPDVHAFSAPQPHPDGSVFVPWLPCAPRAYAIPTHPAQLFTDPYDWERMCQWWYHCRNQLQIAEQKILQGKPYHGFDYNPSRCPGGKDGLYIPFERRAPDFNWTAWDLRDFHAYGGAIKPLDVHVDPQTRTTLKLKAMYAEAVRTSYSDVAFIEELLTHGLDSRAFVRQDIMLMPNYKGFFDPDNFAFSAKKRMAKATAFAIDRIPAYGCTLPPFVHLYVNPRNVAIKPGTDPPKRRVTVDYAASRNLGPDGLPGYTPRRAKDPGPLSVNAGVDLQDPLAFPEPVEYMDLRKFARGAATLQSIRSIFPNEPLPPELELFQAMDDMEQYYEQLPRPSHLDPTNVMLIWSVSGHVDERGCFGACDMPHLSMRLESFFLHVTVYRAWERQRTFTTPTHLARWLTPWTTARRAAGGSASWTVAGGYIDDTANACFQFFGEDLMKIKRVMWAEFGLIVQPVKVDEKPVTVAAPRGQDMTVLGVTSSPARSQLLNEVTKITKYAELAERIAVHAREHGFRVPLELVDRCLGQLGFAAMLDPSLTGDLTVVRDMLSANWARRRGQQVLVSERAASYLDALAARLRLSTAPGALAFRCYAPRQGILGDSGRPIMYIWTDASCANAGDAVPPKGMTIAEQLYTPNLFHGWGAMFWLEGDDTVYFSQQFITYNARKSLDDSTACEMFGTSEAVYMQMLLTQAANVTVDMAHVGDSQSATAIVNTGKPKQTAERVLFWQFCDLRDRMSDTLLVSTQQLRKYNQETDILASLQMDPGHTNPKLRASQASGWVALQSLVDLRFGRHMQMCWLKPPPLDDTRKRMSVVVRAKGSRKRLGSRSVLPQLLKAAGAYAPRR